MSGEWASLLASHEGRPDDMMDKMPTVLVPQLGFDKTRGFQASGPGGERARGERERERARERAREESEREREESERARAQPAGDHTR